MPPDLRDSIGEELAGWGKVALLETIGRSSGRKIQSAVGFVEAADGSLYVAAGSDSADWALNLRAHPGCRATIGEHSAAYTAHELDGAERNGAVAALILKYGTPAERLGHGPVFRLASAAPAPEAHPAPIAHPCRRSRVPKRCLP